MEAAPLAADRLLRSGEKAGYREYSDCRWEWCSGTFTIQRLKRPKEDAPYPSLVDEIDALRIRVAP